MRLQKWSQTDEPFVWHTNSRYQDDRKFIWNSSEIILIDAKVKKVKAAIQGKISLPALDIFVLSYLKKKTMAKTVLMYTQCLCSSLDKKVMKS